MKISIYKNPVPEFWPQYATHEMYYNEGGRVAKITEYVFDLFFMRCLCVRVQANANT